MNRSNGRNRVVIEAITPQVECARHPVCRIIGEEVVVTAVVFADGHEHLGVQLLHQRPGDRKWRFTPMTASGNDIWTGSFTVDTVGEWHFSVLGWVDHFTTWESELRKRLAAQAGPENAVAVADPEATIVSSTSGGWTVTTEPVTKVFRSPCEAVPSLSRKQPSVPAVPMPRGCTKPLVC